MSKTPVISKADGSRMPFDPNRLTSSLRRAGAAPHVAEHITKTVTDTIASGVTSHEIHKRAFALLRKESRPLAARYALRRALLELGPSGHPFEDFISHLYTVEGWKVETRKIIRGHCVSHEVDFYASHPEQNMYMAAELKYHNKANYKTDLKVSLYVKSRFDDIFSCQPSIRACPIDRGILVTNTKFTSEAIAYAECAGVELLGWGYPAGQSLFERMTKARVYPITSLTQLKKAEKRMLIDSGTIAVDQVLRDRKRLRVLHLSPKEVGDILAEADALLSLPETSRDTL